MRDNKEKIKKIIIIVLICLCIGVISFVIFNRNTEGLISTISSSEKNTFNEKFLKYKGEKSGGKVKDLISDLKSNASAQKENYLKIPTVIFINSSGDEYVIDGGENCKDGVGNYSKKLQDYMTKIVSTNTYYIEFERYTSGKASELIKTVKIYYNKPEL